MKKILMIIRELQDNSGVTSVIKNNYDKLVSEGYLIDFCAMYDVNSDFREYVISRGSNYYVYPQKNGRPDKSKEQAFLDDIFHNNSYDLIHVHITGKYACMALKKAKKFKIPYRIYHAHNPKGIQTIKEFLRWVRYDPRCVYYANNYLACSSVAGKSIFGRRSFFIIRNAIDVRKFRYNANMRKKNRNKLNIAQNALVLGTVCRITEQKNPKFIIEIFYELLKMNENFYLIWVGTGNQHKEICDLVEEYGIKNNVLFLGERNDVDELYSVFDLFLLPSLYEGLGISFIESQASGNLTYASNKVPNDTNITDLISYISLNFSAKKWADIIFKDLDRINNINRDKYNDIVLRTGYDIFNNQDLLKCYEDIFEEKKEVCD